MKKEISYIVYTFLLILIFKVDLNASTFSSCGVKDIATEETVICNNISNLNYAELKKAKKVKKLILRNNNIKAIPKEIFELTTLEYLDLGKNNIKTIDSSIQKLTSLKRLFLDTNLFGEIPSSIFKLKKLNELNFNYNNINYLPKSINNLKELKILRISYNSLNSIEKLTTLNKLSLLELNNNLLMSLPDMSKTNIKTLNLDCNILSSKKVSTNLMTYSIKNQLDINVVNNKYKITDNWYNKKNQLMNSLVLSNNQKLVNFKKYELTDLKNNNNQKVKISDYLDSNNKVIKSGKISANIQLVKSNNIKVVIKKKIDLSFVLNESSSSLGDGEQSDSTTGNWMMLKLNILSNIKNKQLDKKEDHFGQSINKFLQDSIADDVNSFALTRFFILRVIVFIIFALPFLIIFLLLNKIKDSIEKIREI